MRLLFAALVVLSHSPELIDGNRSREILTRLFGTLSFGEVAVDGFFLVSGYLVTGSFVRRPAPLPFLARRMLRILPGYLVAFWACVLILAPVAGGAGAFRSLHPISQNPLIHNLTQALFLQQPDVPDSFQGLPYAVLDGSLWTIPYEARCYAAVLLFGSLGRLTGIGRAQARWILLLAATAGLLVGATGILDGLDRLNGPTAARLIGVPAADLDFLSVFGIGATFYLFRDAIRPTRVKALAAALALVLLMLNRYAANMAFAVLGGYLIVWFALHCPVLRISRAADRTDISYGLYLYAWPIQNLVIWLDRTINPWLLCAITLPGAGMLAYASWRVVEERAIRLGHHMVRAEAGRR